MMRWLKRLWVGLLAFVVIVYVALTVYAYWPGEPELPIAKLATAEDRFVTVNGLALRYREYGVAASDRPDLLLIHGFANSLQSWRELAPRLADCCHVIAIDMPGYGLSAKPVEFDYHNGPQATMMVAAARALALQKPIYVGHSLGGAIALHAVIQDRSSRGLVLMNPGILTTGVPKFVQITLPPLPRLSAKQFGSRRFRERFLQLSYIDPTILTPQIVDDLMLGARSEGYLQGMTSLMQQYSEGDELPLLGKVTVPTLIAWGDRDRNKLLSEANDLQRAIAGAKLVRFANAGHYVHEEAATAVSDAMRAWLAALPAAPQVAPSAATEPLTTP